jgi:hypothetical protein
MSLPTRAQTIGWLVVLAVLALWVLARLAGLV